MKWLVMMAAALWPVKSAAEEGNIRVLIVDGFSNHDWAETTRLVRGILERAGGMEVQISTCPPQGTAEWKDWRPDFSRADVVVQNCNDIRKGGDWPDEVKTALEQHVAGGGGLFVWHSANNAFANWPAYDRMIGLGWRAKHAGTAIRVADDGTLVRIPPGEGAGTTHGARQETLVHSLGNHPIHAGLPAAWLTPDLEVYSHPRGPAANLTVLSWGHDRHSKQNWPLEWTVRFGRGRVYTSTFGHVWTDEKSPERMRAADVETLTVRAVRWLAGREVAPLVPADFPTAEKVSIRGE